MGFDGDTGGTIKRVSLVRLRRDLPRATCLERWAGEHADLVRGLDGILEYTVDISSEQRPSDGWDAIATLRFADAAALQRFQEPDLQERLLATRDDFAQAADVFFVDQHTLIAPGGRA